MENRKGYLEVIVKLHKAGYEAYLVGACVRDMLMEKEPNDWDICTNALPEEVLELFPLNRFKIIPTGIQHGTITIVPEGLKEGYEVTTYRVDGDYSDGRRPDEVLFTGSIEEDLSRRDFTINAMAFDGKEVVDYFGGKEDIKKGLIRCVGNPDKRFEEDSLRVLRALRFASTTGFKIEEETSKSVIKNCKGLINVSQERITEELKKILKGKGVEKVFKEYKEVISEAMCEITVIDNWEEVAEVLGGLTESYELGMAVLMYEIHEDYRKMYKDSNGSVIGRLLEKMKFSNKEITNISSLANQICIELDISRKFIMRMLNKLGDEQFRNLLKLKIAYERDMKEVAQAKKLQEILNGMDLSKECYNMKDLKITGKDLIELGYTPGKELGETLNKILMLVIDGEIENKKRVLKDLAKELVKNTHV